MNINNAAQYTITIWIITIFCTLIHGHCPIIRTYSNNTGVLLFNKTAMATSSNCQWLVAGTQNQRIIVQFDYVLIPISIKELIHNGCARGVIELWTPGLEYEKVKICGERKNVRIGGVGQTLLIELKISDPQLDVNFLMHYKLVEIERRIVEHTIEHQESNKDRKF
ncbi:unnamed protein product [Didymodactylos carnosus]|uniref:CUB domain-containing protein n=1 Tax=Didymodactylos carnosus TaxID=1234261 RepID=A0A814ADJ5_9BILA|nr:unnamed protein product [Didymodactylos carnosus]CAF0996051.1 unnamed protein product [Didymodactylos carnosus]CAF3692214.1 unnamed protein product [Didymodactylos carnosus]CAF3765762.1 unnamed protein product [Didymodactylos carnosus]